MGDSLVAKTKGGVKRKRFDNGSSSAQITRGDGSANLPTIAPCSTKTPLTKKLCFWGKDEFDRNYNFFVVDVCIDKRNNELTRETKELAVFNHNILHTHTTAQEKEARILTPVFSFPTKNVTVPFVFNSFATLDHLVYSIGGLFTLPESPWGEDSKQSGSNLVHYFDMATQYDIVWKQGPPMLSHRQNPQVLATNRKLFVFGCYGEDKCPHNPSCVWAESLNVSIDEWTPLSVPRFESSFIVSSATPTKKNDVVTKIYALVDHGIFHEYDIDTNCWTCIANYGKNFSGIISQPTLVRNVLYWAGNDMFAYDILKDREFEGPVQDFSFQRAMRQPMCKPRQYVNSDDNEDSDESRRFDSSDEEDDMRIDAFKPALLHLGGRYFCVMAFLRDLDEDSPSRIHCLIVKVSRTNECYKFYKEMRRDVDKFFLGARVISCESFPMDRKLEFLNGRVMMI